MTTDEQAGRAPGSVPHAYRNAIFWRWTPAMPSSLPSAFVTLLYALGTAADAAGKLKFRDGKAIRIKDIAAAVKADEKDVRRYIDAAIAAGVLGIEGERRRGRAALYVLILSPWPDWDAATASLDASKRKSRKAPPWMKNGGHAPELPARESEKERGTRPRMSSGDTPPFGSGDTPPNNPGIAKELPQETAEVGEQPQVVGAPDEEQFPAQGQDHHDGGAEQTEPRPLDFTRCARCHERMVPRPGRTTHTHCRQGDAA